VEIELSITTVAIWQHALTTYKHITAIAESVWQYRTYNIYQAVLTTSCSTCHL